MAAKKRLNPRIEAVLMFAVVVIAAALAAFVKSLATKQPFSLDWGVTLLAGATCAAIVYIGPALLHHITSGRRR